jgi:ATP-dependent Clp protease ATP-binding subunit ClpA
MDRNVCVALDDSAWEFLIENGYDAAMGARPMYRLIQDQIKIPLAKKILFDKIENNVTVNVRALDKKLELVVERQAVLHRSISEYAESEMLPG